MINWIKKHRILLYPPNIMKQEFQHVRYGKWYWLKYLIDKKFRKSEQTKLQALQEWSDEMDWKLAFGNQTKEDIVKRWQELKGLGDN